MSESKAAPTQAKVEEFKLDDYVTIDSDEEYLYMVRTGDPLDIFRSFPNYIAVNKLYGRIEYTGDVLSMLDNFKAIVAAARAEREAEEGAPFDPFKFNKQGDPPSGAGAH